MVVVKHCAGDAWQRYAPPERLVAESWWWAWTFFWIVVVGGAVFLALFAFEFPRGLRFRAKALVFLKKVWGYVWISLWATPGFASIIGLVALWSWFRDDVYAGVACVASYVITWRGFFIALAAVIVLAVLYFKLVRSLASQ